MAHDYDDIEEWFGSELADDDGLTYGGKTYDALVVGSAESSVDYPQAGKSTQQYIQVDVRISDFASGHPARRETCAFRGTTYRIETRATGSTNKTYRLTLKQQHAKGE